MKTSTCWYAALMAVVAPCAFASSVPRKFPGLALYYHYYRYHLLILHIEAINVLGQAITCEPAKSPDACAGLNGEAESVLPVLVATNGVSAFDSGNSNDARLVAAFQHVTAQLNNDRAVGLHYSDEDVLREVEAYKAEQGQEVGVATFGFFKLLFGLISRLFSRR